MGTYRGVQRTPGGAGGEPRDGIRADCRLRVHPADGVLQHPDRPFQARPGFPDALQGEACGHTGAAPCHSAAGVLDAQLLGAGDRNDSPERGQCGDPYGVFQMEAEVLLLVGQAAGDALLQRVVDGGGGEYMADQLSGYIHSRPCDGPVLPGPL